VATQESDLALKLAENERKGSSTSRPRNEEVDVFQLRLSSPIMIKSSRLSAVSVKFGGTVHRLQVLPLIGAPGGVFNARMRHAEMAFIGVFSSWLIWARNSAFPYWRLRPDFFGGSQREFFSSVPLVLTVYG